MTVRPFEELIDEHGPVVMRVIRDLLGPAEAEDAWSETFLAALEAYPRLRPDSNIGAWLVTIAHHKAIDQLRSRRRVAVPSAELPDRIADDGCVGDGDADLWAALEGLPFKQRAAVAYHHIGGLRYAEVGELIDSTEVAARRSAADGIAALRRIYRRGAP
ncbi:MAG: sigma-70 family RNA polymerase sigma factor [Actinomycetota bacterium]|jgi:RNA polymerase sigma factor (sigma-70 family)|nr:sigma-70 family RNA polymerase sigma factor [Actinomycetota bacterium]